MNRRPRFWLVSLILIYLAACQSGPGANPERNPTSPSPSPVVQSNPIPFQASPTPEILQTQASATLTIPDTPTPPPTVTATLDALPLFFPTPDETAATEENRPPLYPVPWSISPYDHFFFARPISADYPAEPLSDFRYGGVYFGPNEVHTGIDIDAPVGTPVLAAGPGTVVWAGIGLYSGSIYYPEDPYGLAVVIRHNFGYEGQQLYTVYAHMSEVDVVLGQWLKIGDQVGKVGRTGFTTGPHLHFEVRLGTNDFNSTRNPELWLVPPQGWGVLVGRVMDTRTGLLSEYTIYVTNLSSKRKWTVTTYGPLTVNSDEHYHENVVLSDLPAGVYELLVPYAGLDMKAQIQILPGQVTYFSFQGYTGYNFGLQAADAFSSTPTPPTP